MNAKDHQRIPVEVVGQANKQRVTRGLKCKLKASTIAVVERKSAKEVSLVNVIKVNHVCGLCCVVPQTEAGETALDVIPANYWNARSCYVRFPVMFTHFIFRK